jgi:flagellar hook-basal body complex protein FliE
MTIPPIAGPTGGEWSVGTVQNGPDQPAAGQAGQASGGGFGQMLAKQVGDLSQLQTDAAQASQALAAGTATDTTQVVMAVERARLAMQLASQVRTKAVEAVNDIFHTQV